MNALQTQFDRDVANVETEMPCSFFFPVDAEKPFTGQKSPTVASMLGTDAGYSDDFDFDLVVRSALWTGGAVAPTAEQEIAIIDEMGVRKKYIIKSVNVSPDGVALTFGIKASN